MASRRSLRGLDLLNFFTANVQTGFGPFISAYLTMNKWTQGDIGNALSIGTLTAMVSQIPAGIMLDALPYKRAAGVAALLSISACALIMGVWPARLPVMLAEILHGFASCVIGPVIAAISVALVGRAAIGDRLGRNARWGAIGNGLAAALMGLCGEYSIRAVFWLTAFLAIPAAMSLGMIGHVPNTAPKREAHRAEWTAVRRFIQDRRLVAFGLCAALFHLANTDMMPLAAGRVTASAGSLSTLLIAGAITVPQLVMALIAPRVGQAAEDRGRRFVLMIGFGALPLRGILLYLLPSPWLMVPVQALDGISAAVFGVMLPLIAADLTAGREGFNLCIGMLGLAAGVGATLSTAVGGHIAQWFGLDVAFLSLTAIGGLATMLVWAIMPDTAARPADEPPFAVR